MHIDLVNLSDDQILCEARKEDDSDELIKVYETERAFLAPQMATKKDERGVRVSKTILQKDIPSDQAIKLFVEGKTDLLPEFVSKKKGRKFAAHLTLDRATGKIGFEFAVKKKAPKDKDAADGEEEVKPAKKKAKKKAAKKKSTKKKTAKKKSAKKDS